MLKAALPVLVRVIGLSRAGSADGLAGESEAGGKGCTARCRTRAGEAHRLWAAGAVVSEGDGCGTRSTGGRRKGYTDRAVAPRHYAGTAIIGSGKVAGIGARKRDAGNAQGRVAGIAQGNGLSRAGGANGLAGEREAGRGKAGGGRRPGAGEAHALGAAAGVASDGNGCGASSRHGGLEGHADRAIGPCRYARPATIGRGKIAGVGARHLDAGEGQSRIAGIRQCSGLGGTGGTYSLTAEGNGGWTQRETFYGDRIGCQAAPTPTGCGE